MTVLPTAYRASALIVLAHEFVGRRDFAGGMGATEKALTIDASPRSKERFVSISDSAGNAAMGQKQFADAISIYSRALDISPAHRTALNQRGYAFQNAGQLDSAAADYG